MAVKAERGVTAVITGPRAAPASLRARLARGVAIAALAWMPLAALAQSPWFDQGRPTAWAHEGVAVLAGAASHGLDVADYGLAPLRQALEAAARAPVPPARAAELAQALEAALQRYLGHLHAGRIDPLQVHQRMKAPARPALDAAAVLREAVAAGRLQAAVDAVVPRLPIYENLRLALATYRDLAPHPAWGQPLPALPPPLRRGDAAALQPGQPWGGLDALAQRLHALGDLATPPAPRPDAVSPALYDGAVVAAVQAFQRRHGLRDDGVIGRATWRALQVSPQARARQIELTLERMRWTPLQQGPRMVVINVPEFVLRAYEVDGARVAVRRTMKVIVGRDGRNRTPLFGEDMRRIEFSPYWNVPPRIARNELVPQLRRSPGVFGAQGYEFVTAGGQVVDNLRGDLLDAVLAGQARIRQRPGPKNALGDIKFVFPNQDAIYLHHTPAVGLFAPERRDFSHGCIRVEDPVGLASFVLARQPGWTEEKIRTAMAGARNQMLTLDEPVPVLITYATALVLQGRVHFFDDVYGYDALLDRALSAASRARKPATPTGAALR